jgi:hypothetical protein
MVKKPKGVHKMPFLVHFGSFSRIDPTAPKTLLSSPGLSLSPSTKTYPRAKFFIKKNLEKSLSQSSLHAMSLSE